MRTCLGRQFDGNDAVQPALEEDRQRDVTGTGRFAGLDKGATCRQGLLGRLGQRQAVDTRRAETCHAGILSAVGRPHGQHRADHDRILSGERSDREVEARREQREPSLVRDCGRSCQAEPACGIRKPPGCR